MVVLSGLADKRLLAMGAVNAFHHPTGLWMRASSADVTDAVGVAEAQPVAADELAAPVVDDLGTVGSTDTTPRRGVEVVSAVRHIIPPQYVARACV